MSAYEMRISDWSSDVCSSDLNPKAAEKFAQVTHAYELLMDKDKRAQFDRGEIDGDGNPTAPFGFGGGRGGGFRSGGPGGGSHEFSGEGADFGDIFEGLFGGGRRQQAGGGFGGFGRSAPPQKGGNITYRQIGRAHVCTPVTNAQL